MFTSATNAAFWVHAAPPERGQGFPSRPIRVVVATTAGGSPDLIARALSRPAEQYLGQNLIVDNRGGANGIIAATIVANARLRGGRDEALRAGGEGDEDSNAELTKCNRR